MFNRATLVALMSLVRRRVIYELKGVISAGKESRVYWGKGFRGEDLAIKIYLTTTAEFRKGILKYIKGDVRFEKYVPRSTKKLMGLWARKEFRNYLLLYRVGVSVPKPFTQYQNILVMEFIGDSGIRAPLLREVRLDSNKYEELFNSIVKDVRRAYLKARLVHGDLSEYNVMVWRGKHYIIDVSQAVRVDHPNALDFLARDLRNIHRYFAKELGLNIPSVDRLFEFVVGRVEGLW